MANLDSKIAIVTGVSRGVGAGIAKAFARAGASVIVNYAGNPEVAATTVAAITAEGGKRQPWRPTCRRPATWLGSSTTPIASSVHPTSSSRPRQPPHSHRGGRC